MRICVCVVSMMAKKTKYYKKFDKSYPVTTKKFQTILGFYLFECPTPGTSVRAKTFHELGWKGKNQFAKLKSEMLKNATPSLKLHYHPCKKDELKNRFDEINTVKPVDEYCVFLKHDEKTVMQSLFSAIRNAFAHGSFGIETFQGIKVYFFSNYNEYLKAEIVLQEDTLLNWIEILKSGYTKYNK